MKSLLAEKIKLEEKNEALQKEILFLRSISISDNNKVETTVHEDSKCRSTEDCNNVYNFQEFLKMKREIKLLKLEVNIYIYI